MSLGTMFVNEIGYPVESVELAEGQVFYWLSIQGPVDLPSESEIRLHGTDGSLIFVGPWSVDLRYVKMAAECDGTVHICMPTTILSVDGWPRV